MAVVSGLTRFPDHLHWVIQTNENKSDKIKDNYSFLFFSMNKWEKITVDKTLPVSHTHVDYSRTKSRSLSDSYEVNENI